MNIHIGHLSDERLFECYVASRGGERLDPRAADHMSGCRECNVRYEELLAFMSALRSDAEAEVDEQFPAERLRIQQQQILRRLDHVGRSARVITFPGRDPAGGSRAAVRLTPRWVAAAAAAGLFIGVGLGGYLGPERLHRSGSRAPATFATARQPRSAPATTVRGASTPAEAPDDDAFLGDLELALARHHSRELRSFDAMTPHVRDIDVRVR